MRRSLKYTLLFVVASCVSLAVAAAVLISQTGVPPEAIRTSVSRNADTMERAWRLPVASTFTRDLMWQSNSSMCGPASAANVLRSFGEAATSEQAVLKDTGRCWTGFCMMGLSLDELADVVRKNTRRTITVLRDLSPDEFRQHMRQANDPGRRYIINFNRKLIFGAGAGHHSPVGGYLEQDDLVLVLDVNREFGPWMVEGARLYDAMNTRDGDTTRGLLLIE